jgi:hypothetical protein
MYFQSAVPQDLHVTNEAWMSHFVVITNNAGLYLGENTVASLHTDYAFCLEDVKT